MPKFAANLTMMFNEVSFPQRFSAAARAGFDAVEFMFPYDHPPQEVAGWLRENGLQNVLFNMPPGDWTAGDRGMASLPGREEEFRASVARALEYADALGTPRIHAMAGLLVNETDRASHRRTYIENLRWAAQQLDKYGRVLLIEPINTRDIPGYFLNTQADAHSVREEVGEQNLLVQMDFYHAQIVEGDIAVKFRKYFAQVGHIQVAGVPDRNEPDDGEVNYRYLFTLIDDLNYPGWVGCEYRPRAGTVEGLGWMRSLLGDGT